MTAPKSYTQWSLFNKCGAQYKFQYIDKIPRPARSASADRGVDIHAAVEAIINKERTTFPEEWGHLEHYTDFFLNLAEMGAIAELPFKLDENWEPTDEKPWIRGFIDIIVPPSDDRENLYIYELKTGNPYDDHVHQRQFYGTVGLGLYNAPLVHVIGVYLDQGMNEQNTYEAAKLKTYRYFWKQRLDMLDREEGQVPDPGIHCRWCPYSADKGGPCKFSGN